MATKSVESAANLQGPIRKTTAWSFITDFAEQVKRVPAIDKIVVISRIEQEGKSEWSATLDGAPFRWIQRETFFGSHWRLTFDAIDGDFDSFAGAWTVSDQNGDGIRLSLEMGFALDIPVMEIGIGDEIKTRVQAFSDSLMSAAVAYCGEKSVDARTNPRVDILTHAAMAINGVPVRCLVRNASRRGLLLAGVDCASPGPIEVDAGGERVKGTLIPEGGRSRYARIVLDRDLTTGEFDGLCADIRSTAHRRKERVNVEGNGEFVYPRRSLGVLVHNISAGGMLVSGPREPIGLESFQMRGIPLDPRAIHPGPFVDSWRIALRNELSETQIAALVADLQTDSDTSDVAVYETMTSMRPGTARVRVDESIELITRA